METKCVSAAWLLLIATFAAVPIGCKSDDEARVNLGREPLAVGAYLPFAVIDGCAGGGKINFCSTERLVSLDSYSVDDPTIAEIVPAASVPAGLLSGNVTLAMRGLAPGKTIVRASATFDDGSVRTATADLKVAAVSRVIIDVSCDRDATDEMLFGPEQSVGLQIDLLAGQTRLAGQMVQPIEYDPPAGTFQRGSPAIVGHRYAWRTPATPARLVLRSPLDPLFVARLESYGPERVTKITATPASGLPPPYLVTGVGGEFPLDVRVEVDGQRPCNGRLPIVATTLSPAVCAGPAGEVDWTGTTRGRISFSVVSEGACRLSLGALGGGSRTPIEIAYRMIHPSPPGWPVRNESCLPVGEVRCDGERGAILTCDPATDTTGDAGRWRESRSCGDLICDYLPPGERGCADPIHCIQCI